MKSYCEMKIFGPKKPEDANFSLTINNPNPLLQQRIPDSDSGFKNCLKIGRIPDSDCQTYEFFTFEGFLRKIYLKHLKRIPNKKFKHKV